MLTKFGRGIVIGLLTESYQIFQRGDHFFNNRQLHEEGISPLDYALPPNLALLRSKRVTNASLHYLLVNHDFSHILFIKKLYQTSEQAGSTPASGVAQVVQASVNPYPVYVTAGSIPASGISIGATLVQDQNGPYPFYVYGRRLRLKFSAPDLGVSLYCPRCLQTLTGSL